jgi:hypothetical protein
VRFGFIAVLLILAVVALLSDGIYDTGDGILHYQIARWSWHHPELFLHHWGKPVFTLLASPFAQFGYKGAVFFNLLCHAGTAWVTWRIAVRLKCDHAVIAPILVLAAPISWGVWQSGLTEPLFALTLMSGIYFIVAGRYSNGALLLSLLPFVRTEGFLLLPLFAIYFLIRREFVAASLLCAGTIIYSVIGGIFVYNDFLWVVHGNPYKGESNYGHGELLYFVARNEFLFGWILSALIAAGLIASVVKTKTAPATSMAMLLLVCGSFAVFFIAHSVFWWKGLFGSYGLIRVIACIVPCGVLIGLSGLRQITRLYSDNRIATGATLVAVCGLTLYNAIDQHGFIRERDNKQELIFSTAQQVGNLRDPGSRIYYGYPLITHALNGDPFNPEEFLEMWGLESRTDFRSGDLVVWDSHFGPVQYNISEQRLLSIPGMEEVYRSERGNDGNRHYFVITRYR